MLGRVRRRFCPNYVAPKTVTGIDTFSAGSAGVAMESGSGLAILGIWQNPIRCLAD